MPFAKTFLSYYCGALAVLHACLHVLVGVKLALGVSGCLLLGMLLYGSQVYLKRDLPGPRPAWLFGSSEEVVKHGLFRVHQAWLNEYGTLYRFYDGLRDWVVVGDLDLAHRLYVKEFSKAQDRPAPPRVRQANGLLFAKGAYWRRMRRTVAPSFATKHLRRFGAQMNEAASTAVDLLKKYEKQGDKVEFWSFIGRATMEVIGSTAFGTKFDSQLNKDDPLTKAAANVFAYTGMHHNPTAAFFQAFPILPRILAASGHPRMMKILDALHVLDATSLRITHGRRMDSDRDSYDDFVTLLLMAKDKETGQTLTDNDIKDQANTFLLAGYETTSNCVTFTTYLLSLQKNEEKCRLLQEEIDRLCPIDSDNISYEDLKDFTYTEAVVNESLRLYPPGAQLIRKLEEDIDVGDVVLKKGQNIVFPVYAIHHHPELWEDPEEFRPERFISGKGTYPSHPCAYVPFGIGPRSCIGSRFALEEAKLLIIKLFRNFSFKLEEDVVNKGLPLRNGITLTPYQGLPVRVSSRRPLSR